VNSAAQRRSLRKRLRRDFISAEQLWEEVDQFMRELPFYLAGRQRRLSGRISRDRLN
jgi:hypothetical protein